MRKCEVYGFDRIKNLKAFCIAVAVKLAAKKKPVPITEKERRNQKEVNRRKAI